VQTYATRAGQTDRLPTPLHRIKFDDLHQSGLYTWTYLHELGRNKYHRIKEYLRRLHTDGLSRILETGWPWPYIGSWQRAAVPAYSNGPGSWLQQLRRMKHLHPAAAAAAAAAAAPEVLAVAFTQN
jgi:hypothetical protein